MFDLFDLILVGLICLTYGYLLAVWHANFLDQRDAARRKELNSWPAPDPQTRVPGLKPPVGENPFN